MTAKNQAWVTAKKIVLDKHPPQLLRWQIDQGGIPSPGLFPRRWQRRLTARITSTVILEASQEVAPEIDPGILIENTNFRDQYEIDSIDFLRFVLILEAKAEIKIPESDYPKLSSLTGCINYFSRLGDYLIN